MVNARCGCEGMPRFVPGLGDDQPADEYEQGAHAHSATGRGSRQLKAAATGRPVPPATSCLSNRIGIAWTASRQAST